VFGVTNRIPVFVMLGSGEEVVRLRGRRGAGDLGPIPPCMGWAGQIKNTP